jgi:hypothetical protein
MRTRHLAWCVALPLLASCATLPPEARGRRDADHDADRGHFVQLTWGLRGADALERDRELFEKYGVRMAIVAGCVVSPEEEAYWESYNAGARSRIDERFGPGYLERALHDVYRGPAPPAHQD